MRISADDAEFLSRFDIPEAKTPSDKLRAILSQARRQREGLNDYGRALEILREILEPSLKEIRQANSSLFLRSELVDRLGEWIPETAAWLTTQVPSDADNKEAWVQFEAGLAHRLALLLEAFLRLGVTTQAPCYDPKVISNHLGTILELADLIQKQHNPKI